MSEPNNDKPLNINQEDLPYPSNEDELQPSPIVLNSSRAETLNHQYHFEQCDSLLESLEIIPEANDPRAESEFPDIFEHHSEVDEEESG